MILDVLRFGLRQACERHLGYERILQRQAVRARGEPVADRIRFDSTRRWCHLMASGRPPNSASRAMIRVAPTLVGSSDRALRAAKLALPIIGLLHERRGLFQERSAVHFL